MSSEKTCGTCQRRFTTDADFLLNTSRWRICSMEHLWFNCQCGSTLILRKGQYDWYNPSGLLSPQASSIFNRLANRESIPHMPHAIVTVQSLLSDPNAEISTLASAIRADPLLSARILAMANNLKLATGEKITSLEHAIAYVGRSSLSEIVAIMGIHSLSAGPKNFTSTFWRDALLTGNIASALAPSVLTEGSADEAWIASALCNVGKIVAFMVEPEAADRVFRTSTREPHPSWRSIERRENSIDHTILGEIGAMLWGLPTYISDTCRQHHDLPAVGRGQKLLRLPELVALSNQLMHWIHDDHTKIDDAILHDLLAIIGRDLSDMSFLKNQVKQWRQRQTEVLV